MHRSEFQASSHIDGAFQDSVPPLWPQRTVCFETELTENSVFSIEYEFENHTPYIELDENRVTGAADAGKVLSDGSRLGNWLGEQLPRSGSHFSQKPDGRSGGK